MSNSKNKLILNPDFYSLEVYAEQEENEQSVYIRVLIQLFMVFIVFVILIFSYRYFMKNYYEKVSLWVIEVKGDFIVEQKKAPIVIREESMENKIENKNTVKIISLPKVKPQVLQQEELTDEYIKLVEQSLGNY